MAKGWGTTVEDLRLDAVAAATRLDIVSDVTAPADLSNTLANVTIDSSDFAITDDPTDGRRLTVAAQYGIATTAAGTPAHIVLSLSGVILAYDSVTGDDLVNPGTANTTEFYLREADPA